MIPNEFKERMISLIGEEAYRLFDEIENGDATKAFRVNTVKISGERFEQSGATIEREAIPLVQNAYYTREKFPGSLPEHHAGAIYMQDPSAMSTVLAFEVKEGMRVLDCCAAPGGKTGQIAAAVGEGGMVVANEYDSARSHILQSNIERMGSRNTVILNVDTSTLAEFYPEGFDLVLCDAPCSGEGMFRKNELATSEWSAGNVEMCAERQREILSNVVKCVKKGGALIYSTCTFAPEENEDNVVWLLDNFPEFELCDVSEKLKSMTVNGIMRANCNYDMTKTRRFYPHVSRGEGQFIALLKRTNITETEDFCAASNTAFTAKNTVSDEKKSNKQGKKENNKLKNKQDVELIELGSAFLKENLTCEPRGELAVVGNRLWLVPDVRLLAFGVVAAGVCVGEAQKGRLVPHHQLFSAYGAVFKRRLHLSPTSIRAHAYLLGEELQLRGTDKKDLNEDAVLCPNSLHEDLYVSQAGDENGWAAVVVGGCACGGGKVSGACESDGFLEGGVLKNHYPKGLRNKRIG